MRPTSENEASEQARRKLGIDGTRGDAQDVAHPFQPHHQWGSYCLPCGLSEAHTKHAAAS